MSRLWSVCLRAMLMCAARDAVAQGFVNPARTGAIDQQSMRTLADAIHEYYQTVDRDSLLDVTFRVQMIQNEWSAARQTLATLRAIRAARSSSPLALAINVQYEILAAANARLSPEGDFSTAFGAAFDSVLASLDNRTAALALNALSVSPSFFAGALSQLVAADRDRPSLTLDQALSLARAYQATRSYEVMAPLVGRLIATDDERRYIIQRNVLVPVGDGVETCAWIVLPRHAARLRALVEYTIYADTAGTFREARHAASNGYVGVTGFSRGKVCSTAAIVPYRYDSADAAALIAWIAKQPWSDGQVGMYSGSYEGFTQWAALKHRAGIRRVRPRQQSSTQNRDRRSGMKASDCTLAIPRHRGGSRGSGAPRLTGTAYGPFCC